MDKYHITLAAGFNNDIKQSLIERIQETVKHMLFAAVAYHNTNKWEDLIDKIVENYNNSRNRMTKFSPAQVIFDNANIVWRNLYENKKLKKPKFVIKVGDIVRVALVSKLFDKGFKQQFGQTPGEYRRRFSRFGGA